MKKSLIIVAIVICLLCIAVAGTVAIYNKNFDINGEGTTVTAKKFYIGQGSAHTFVDAELAPGEDTEWTFTVVNFKDATFTSAVDMSMNIGVSLDGSISNLQVSLVEIVDGVENAQFSLIGKGSNNYNDALAFNANVAKTRTFKIIISWPTGENEDSTADTNNGINGGTSTIKVSVTGTQVLS